MFDDEVRYSMNIHSSLWLGGKFWTCAVPALFANQVGRLRVSKGKELKSNKYYDKWTTVYEHYKTWRKLLTKSGTSVPSNRLELRERLDAVDERGLRGGLLSIKPYVETLFSAFNEFKATYTPIGGVGTLDPIVLDYGSATSQAAEATASRVGRSEASVSEVAELQRYGVERNKVWLAQRAQLESRIASIHAESSATLEAVAKRQGRTMDASTIKTIFELTRQVEGDEGAASFLREVRENFFSRQTPEPATPPPKQTGKKRSSGSHSGRKAKPRASSTKPRSISEAVGDEVRVDSPVSTSSESVVEEVAQKAKRARPDYAAMAGVVTRKTNKVATPKRNRR